MLAANFASISSYSQYVPQRQSPLSPRSANVLLRRPFLPFNEMPDSEPKPRESMQADRGKPTNRFAFFRRNPLMKSSEERTKLRRSAYLKRVKAGQEDQRWGSKSDQILRFDYMNERQRWEEELRRTAPEFNHGEDPEDQENDLPVPSQNFHEHASTSNTFSHSVELQSSRHTMSDEVEAVAHHEEQELEELLALAEDEQSSVQEPRSERWGSDEEDYDDIFMEFISSSQTAQQAGSGVHEGDAMDTSMD